MFGLRPGPFTLVALLATGGKPLTRLPPGNLVEQAFSAENMISEKSSFSTLLCWGSALHQVQLRT